MPLIAPPEIDVAARARLFAASDEDWWTGTRLKDVRHETLSPGGRVALTLFESVADTHRTTGRPHPRLRVSLPPVEDPQSESAFTAPTAEAPNASADAFAEWLATAWQEVRDTLVGEPPEAVAQTSRAYHINSLRTQRTSRFFAAARAHVARVLPPAERASARAAVRILEDRAYAGRIQFDDHDTGTYHSYGKDAPFVHYLETLLKALPEPGSMAMALLSPVQVGAVRRQRKQVQAHLDHLMRHKYAFDGVVESDIEQQLGARLIDRETRHVVSETPESAQEPVPAYEILRVKPFAEHPHAGAWLHRAGQSLRLDDGTEITVGEEHLRRISIDSDRLTFERMPGDSRLRSGVRLDWDGNGWLQPGAIDWVSWAGHCDIKAVLEQLGITLTGAEADTSVTEYRSDTGGTTVYDRDLVMEMVVSAMELGSTYLPTDGSSPIRRGITRFGGARNDSRPDRIQLAGVRSGQGLRWPLSERADAFVVTELEIDGESVDLGRAFYRWHPVDGAIDFAENPRFVKTIEGDTSLLDISGARLVATLLEDAYDDDGYPTRRTRTLTLDLSEGADLSERVFLGSQLHDPVRRTLWKVYLEPASGKVEGQVVQCVRGDDGAWTEQPLPDQTVHLSLRTPLRLTLSREMKRDDPEMFRALLDVALRTGQNICADTDMRSEVWNGVVTGIHAELVGEDAARRTEHWRMDIKARFGEAALDYYLRRDQHGAPEAWCPVHDEADPVGQPDFLWQDFPDVGTKGMVRGDWAVNQTMLQRGIIEIDRRPEFPGGVYVHDDHIKNMFELLFAAMGGYSHCIVHDNKRWGFREESDWKAHIEKIEALRSSAIPVEQTSRQT